VSTSGLVVRRERPADHAAVREVHRAAFAAATPAGDPVEVRLTDELREDAGFLPHLSLVAVVDQKVVGHVIATRSWLEPFGTAVLGLGPLGVHPAHQGQGIGTSLVHALLAVAEACEERVVALLRAPEYYLRFGFRPAADLGIEAPDPQWGGHFQARVLTGGAVQGRFRYAEPFDRL
jgi:putative acetyltransferase